MSTLEELRIAGIRNFGSEADEQQKITFSSPLTLIVGQNGCGKTTIIEGIKYALTGEFPPNSTNGQSFLNDPKQSGLTEVKGFVKLKVKNVNQGTTIINRGAKVSVKGGKMTMKSEDCTLHMQTADNEITLSKRKDEATDIMCGVMGVSKAIINYVLFCHQEESDWPLGTDQEVMSRFDKIFGTTEYNSALEKIRKKRKDLENEVKDKKVGLKELEMIKRQVDSKKVELDKNNENLAQKKEEYEQCERDMKPIVTELNQNLNVEQNLSKLVAERTKVETEYTNEKENRQKVLGKIKNRFNDTVDELEIKIREFKTEMTSKDDELKKSKANLIREKANSESANRKAQDLDRQLTNFYAQKEQQQEAYAEKAELVRGMCDRLKIPVAIDLGNDNDQAEEYAKRAEAAVANEEKKIEELQKQQDQAQMAHEQVITDLQKKKVTTETALKGYREHSNQWNGDVKNLQEAISSIEHRATKQKDMADKIEKLQKVLDDPNSVQNIESKQEQIIVNHTRSAELNVEIEKLDEQIAVLSRNASVLAQVNAKEKQLEKYDSDTRRIRNKHEDKLIELLGGNIEKNYKQRVEQESQRLRTEIERIEKEMRLNDRELTEYLHGQRSKKAESSRLEAKLREQEERIDASCESRPFAEVLAETKENAAKAQMELSKHKSSNEIFKEYMSKVQKKPCCPVCSKDLNGREVEDLNEEWKSLIESMPAKIRQSEQAFKEQNEKLETLLALQPVVESVETMRSENESIKRDLAEIEKKRLLAQTQKVKLEKSIERPKQQIEAAQRMVGDLSLLDDSLREAEGIRNDLLRLKATLPQCDGSGLSLEDAQAKRKTLNDDKKKLEGETRKMEEQLKEVESKRTRMQKVLFELKGEEIKLKEGIQSLDEKRAHLNALCGKIADFGAKIRESEASLVPIENDLKQAQATKIQEKARNAKQLKDEQSKLNELKQTVSSIKRCRTEIRKFAEMNLEESINRNEKQLTDLNRQKNELKSSMEAIQLRIDILNKEIADQGAIERNLQDNLELLKLDATIEQKKEKLDQLRQNEGEIDFAKLQRNIKRLATERDRIVNTRSEISGQMSVIVKRIGDLQTELNDKQHKNAVLNYRRAFYEKFVMEKMIVDLHTYCEALERALTKYHSEKMDKINRLIRELWRNIYKGNDIDSIEIKTEDVKPSGSTKRRSYTYRVVQSKNDTKNNMRGNCSAGQRVLACLVIRIALAETFSANCGVLALDEPTTNLDRVNIAALVEELRRFIEEREDLQHFMLLVITHDEEFIQMLGRSGSYYRVARNPSGKSIIQKFRTH